MSLRSGTLLLLTVILVLGSAAGTPVLAESVAGLVARGNAFYEKGQYEEALIMYRQAQRMAPEEPVVHYNIGNTLYRTGQYEEAYEHYRRAFSAQQDELAQGARYNAGNTHFARENWKDAIQSYKEALRINPDDMDAKRNLELALRNLQREEQQQQQQQQQQQNQDQQDDSEKEDQQQNQDQQDQDKQQQQQQAPAPQPRDQNSSNEDQEKLSREEAMRILDAMKDQDKPPKDRLKVPPPDGKPERDW